MGSFWPGQMREQIVSVIALALSTLTPAVQEMGPARIAVPACQRLALSGRRLQAGKDFLVPVVQSREEVLAEQSLDLNTRAEGEHVNEVFKHNILLALAYFDTPDIPDVPGELDCSFTLQPGKVFAFHGNIASEFIDSVVRIMDSRFYIEEGYKSVGGLGGNGVCHLASLMNWVASEAGLEAAAPTNHNFAPIPGVPKKYWTSIRYCDFGCNSQNQNLYIRNNFDFPVVFSFQADGDKLRLKILKSNP